MLGMRGVTAALTVAVVIAVVSFRLGAASSNGGKRRFLPFAAQRSPQDRTQRVERLKALKFDEVKLAEFVTRFRRCSREGLAAAGYLTPALPRKGGRLLTAADRTAKGNELLRQSKDVLFALLFGDASTGVRFHRVQRELLTLAAPRSKVHVLEFMQASTELSGAGTWQDPEDVASDERADNVIIEVEYGEVEREAIGDGIVTALRLINLLELNEQLIYARMADIEQSTLAE